MLLIIGKGGEGKSRIGRILKRIFGHNMNSGSLQKLETDKFARADQEGKLLYLDDDMKTEALPSTNVIKAIVTAEDEMDLESRFLTGVKVFTDVRLFWKQKMYRRIESMIPIWQTR